ncbi:MAG: DEAD/DEAH box helicase family protein [Cyanobacteria bacterium P01_F01_bin.116]
MKLRPYQKKLKLDLYNQIQDGVIRSCVIAGTGSGKTVVAGDICYDYSSAGYQVLFIVHLDVLVGQTWDKFSRFGLSCGFIKAGWPENPDALIQIASIQTMAKRSDWQQYLNPTLVLYDEGHITYFSGIGNQLRELWPNSIHVPMTATPERLKGPQFGDVMSHYVASPIPSVLTNMSPPALAQLKYFKSPAPDLSQVRLNNFGDYREDDLKLAVNTPEMTAHAIEQYKDLTWGLTGLGFCVDVEHATDAAYQFAEAGIPVGLVTGKTPIDRRKEIYAALAAGEIWLLFSVNVVSIGFDEPSVQVGLMLRPTKSSAMHFQQLGRLMRLAEGKDYGYILDFAGNLDRHGTVEDITEYTLPVSKPKGNGPPPCKACPKCNTTVYSFQLSCPSCGYQWPGTPTYVNLNNLIEVYSQEQMALLDDLTLKQLFHQYRKNNFKNGHEPGAVLRQFKTKTGRDPKPEWFIGSIFGSNPKPAHKSKYLNWLTQKSKVLKKPTNWVQYAYDLEFGLGAFSEIQKLIAEINIK